MTLQVVMDQFVALDSRSRNVDNRLRASPRIGATHREPTSTPC
ncbi:MAG: hypothetical protein JWM55_299 [Acidimicrobiaceae bacterium]|nr:hypothetical protein [Acidimicrobiaceae bacterium]